MSLVEREIQNSKVVFQCGTCQEKISEVVAVNLLNLNKRNCSRDYANYSDYGSTYISVTKLLSESIWYTMGTIGICPNIGFHLEAKRF